MKNSHECLAISLGLTSDELAQIQQEAWDGKRPHEEKYSAHWFVEARVPEFKAAHPEACFRDVENRLTDRIVKHDVWFAFLEKRAHEIFAARVKGLTQ